MSKQISILQKVALVAVGLVTALGLGEVAARIKPPDTQFDETFLHPPTTYPKYEVDSDVVFKPRLAVPVPEIGFQYDARGINTDLSVRSRKGTKRILFLGDSVTRRAHIIQALDAAYPGNTWEFLNAGVDGYDVVQEVAYFKKYAIATVPDRIVITIHNNDLTYFPMLVGTTQDFFWYFSGEAPLHVSLKLYRASYLYRHWVVHEYFHIAFAAMKKDAMPGKTRAALKELKDWADSHHVRLQALILPILKKLPDWTDEERRSRENALNITKSLGIESYDLLPPLDQALKDGVVVTDVRADDTWHPGAAVSKYFASYLKGKGIFDDLESSSPGDVGTNPQFLSPPTK